MTCGGDVHYSADKCPKGSVSEANRGVMLACEALLDLWGMMLYGGTQGLPIWLVGDSCQCWWLYQTEHHHC